MPYLNLKDKDLFGNEAGEDENPEILNSYFVEHEDFSDFFDKSQALSIVSARKGMGKSALLARLQHRLQSEASYEPIIVRAKGNDLLGLGDFEGKDQAYLETYWKQIICKRIILEIGRRIGFAMSSDEISIVEASELEGLKSKNIVGGLIARIVGKLPGLSVELRNSIPRDLSNLLKNYQESSGNSDVWVLVDDIDAKYQNTQAYQARVGSFFSAIRSLAFELKNIRIRATVRSDVWSCLRHLEDLDKAEQYIFEIFWTKKNMRDILANRILSYIKRRHPGCDEAKYSIKADYNKIMDQAFISPIAWGGDPSARIFEAIGAFSNRRPRWMGQLCRMAASEARKNNASTKINMEHIRYSLEEFGKHRRDDLIKEHLHQFCELEQLIDAFRATAKEFTFSEISAVIEANFIRGRSPENIPVVDGQMYREPMDLANFIFKIGIISCIKDGGKNFTHFTDDPDLFKSIENRKSNIRWSIHPSYRNFLNIR
ncbi:MULTISPECIES: hypothetical protein [unclassified Xanthomonas]|uniref:P-loop ATPase, Sll1717 family n=1 Tax=unclassified Xanthomonas TaxID=2643310 RepID=UPI002B22EDD1|nr:MULTISPECIES: hypothetical protein [unclassified Xanthomonas]MEA9563428.1 hypothetical protein [Xanthomonas sp. WHRI 8932A]MEA9634427.1 hypothetical protein [Xanthomonas sp. WHRI 8812E]